MFAASPFNFVKKWLSRFINENVAQIRIPTRKVPATWFGGEIRFWHLTIHDNRKSCVMLFPDAKDSLRSKSALSPNGA